VPKQRAQALVAQLNLTEKVALLHGYGMQTQTEGYIGWVQGNSRLKIPLLGLEDGPQGVADGAPDVTAFPGALTVAQTWDTFSAYYFGQAQAVEQKAKGTAVLLGPGTNLVR
jgi:beta-glucosidase